MYFFLIFLLIILLFICYNMFHRELMGPPVIVVFMYLLCSLIGLFRYEDWNISDYDGYTVFVIMLGLCSFIFTSFIITLYYSKKKSTNIKIISRSRIDISIFLIWSVLIVCIVHDVIFYIFMNTVANAVGLETDSFSQIVGAFHNYKSNNPGEIPIVRGLSLLDIVCNSFSIFFLFVYIHNVCFKQYKKKDFLLLLVVAVDSIYSLLNSSRGDFLVLLAETICLLFFFWNMRSGWGKSCINFKIAKWGVRALSIFIVAFLIMAVMLGRKNDFSELDVKDYLTIYVSSGVRNFDLFLSHSPVKNTVFGQETLFVINRYLYDWFGIGEIYSLGLEFYDVKGSNIGNLFTAFRRYYADFGITGVIILPAFLGGMFSILYNEAKRNARRGHISYSLLLFSYLVTSLFYFPLEDRFFIIDTTMGRIAQYVFLFGLFKYYVEYKGKKTYKCRHLKDCNT